LAVRKMGKQIGRGQLIGNLDKSKRQPLYWRKLFYKRKRHFAF
jgi:hypothetical protein